MSNRIATCFFCNSTVEYMWWGEWFDTDDRAECPSPNAPVGRHDGNEYV